MNKEVPSGASSKAVETASTYGKLENKVLIFIIKSIKNQICYSFWYSLNHKIARDVYEVT